MGRTRVGMFRSALQRGAVSGHGRAFCTPPSHGKPKPRQLIIDLEPFATIRTNTEVVASWVKFAAFCVGMSGVVYAASVDATRSMQMNDRPMSIEQMTLLRSEIRTSIGKSPAAIPSDPSSLIVPNEGIQTMEGRQVQMEGYKFE